MQSKCSLRWHFADTQVCTGSADHKAGRQIRSANYLERNRLVNLCNWLGNPSRVAFEMPMEGQTHAVSNANEIEEIL
jgi:hypothetical protein